MTRVLSAEIAHPPPPKETRLCGQQVQLLLPDLRGDRRQQKFYFSGKPVELAVTMYHHGVRGFIQRLRNI